MAIPFDHDLFTTGDAPAPYLKMVEFFTPELPPGMTWDGRAAPDAKMLGPELLTLPVTGVGPYLYVLTAAQGNLEVRGVAADGEVVYADGRTQPLKWLVGEHIWPAWAGATGRGAAAVALGVNAGGDVVTASLLAVPLVGDAAVAQVRLRTRGGPLQMAVLAVSAGPAFATHMPADTTAFDGYDFHVRGSPVAAHVDPAGPVTVRDGHLAWADGSRARFWGVNLVEEGALPPVEQADPAADRLAGLGFNMVRLHHLDTEKALLNPARLQPGQPLAKPEALDRLDRFVSALEARGIRLFLEGTTLRSFQEGEGVPSPSGVPVGHKYVVHFWNQWRDAQAAWIRAVWGRRNPYTGRSYAEDPGIAVVELENENSLLVGWSGSSLEKLPRDHRQRLDDLWNAWLRKRYGTDGRLEAAWPGSIRSGLQPGESVELGTVAREPSARARVEFWPTRRAADLVTFYGELEADHQAWMARFWKKELGFPQPTVCNTSFGVPAAERLLAACDVVDLHAYWDPIGETQVFRDTSIVQEPGRFLEELSWCQDGRPCTMSEVNHSWPNRHGGEAPLFWSAMAGRQDLDAVLWFAWRHGPWRAEADGPDGALDLDGREEALAQMPLASWLFRTGAVGPPASRFVRWWSPDGILRDLAEQNGLPIDELTQPGAFLSRLVRTSFAPRPPPLTPATEAAGPVAWDDGRFSVTTDRLAAMTGRPPFQVGPLKVEADDAVAAWLWSPEGAIGEAKRLLLVVTGRSEREGTVWPWHGAGTLVPGLGPARLARLRGTVTLTLPGPWRATALDGAGKPAGTLTLKRVKGGLALPLDGVRTPWVALERWS